MTCSTQDSPPSGLEEPDFHYPASWDDDDDDREDEDEPAEAMMASPAALQVVDVSPTKVILDLGCTKALGSRAAASNKATTPTCGMGSGLPHLSSPLPTAKLPSA